MEGQDENRFNPQAEHAISVDRRRSLVEGCGNDD
jgi:hypothetical protein